MIRGIWQVVAWKNSRRFRKVAIDRAEIEFAGIEIFEKSSWNPNLNFLRTLEKECAAPKVMRKVVDSHFLNSLVMIFRSIASMTLFPLTAYMVFLLLGTNVTPVMRANLVYFCFLTVGLLAIAIMSFRGMPLNPYRSSSDLVWGRKSDSNTFGQ
jgi:hypothetical protein